MSIKLTGREYSVIVLGVVVAAASLAVSVKYFWRAFPEATLDLRVNREESAEIARKFLEQRGARLAGYRHAAVFAYSDETKLYLERTQGLERMNHLTRGSIRLWRWSHRWFKPQQKEEFRAEITPTGEVAGFEHEIPEAAAGANLGQAQARDIAEHFLREVVKRDLDELEFVEARTTARPARADHSFTWKQKSVVLGDGSLRIEVGVDGDQVSGYAEFVKIPEQWSRDYERLRSRNTSVQSVDEVFFILLSVAMAIFLVKRLRDRDVPIRLAAGFGLTAALLVFLGHVNTFSLAEFSYPTTDPYTSFLASYFVKGLLIALGVGTGIFLIVAASEPVYREGFPKLVSLRGYLSWKGLRTRSFFMANVVGIVLTFFFFAYQTVFYLAANKLGAWAPSDIPFTDELNTRIPWVSVLFMGFYPAVSEEMQFRAFAIPFLAKISRSWPLAIVLAAFNWGFLHAAYPNQPFFIRGIEVGVGGIVTGLIMLRFGILATLIWHYSVDALYTAFLLLRSTNHYLMISGAVTAGFMLVPFCVALIAYLRAGTFAEEETLTNASQGVSRAPHVEAAAEARAAVAYRPLSRRRLTVAVILTAIFVAVSFVPAYRFGEGIKVAATRDEVMRAAGAFLEKRHVTVPSYRRVAWLHNNLDPLALRYLLERRSVKDSDRIYRQATRLLLWKVRYFRPLEKEEHHVYVDPANGQVFGYNHVVDENAPGESLSLDQARTLAEKSLAERGYDLTGFELQDSRGEKRKARKDYTFVWQAKPGDARNVGDEHYRVQVEIAGGQVVGFSRQFKIPEEWERQRRERRLPNTILVGLQTLVGLGLFGGVIVLFVVQVRQGKIAWRRSVPAGVFFAVVVALAELNGLSAGARLYPTEIPLSTFWLFAGAGLVVLPILAGLSGWVLAGLATSLFPEAWQLLDRKARAAWGRDAIVAVVLSLGAGIALQRFSNWVANAFHAYVPLGIELVPDEYNASVPALAFFLHALAYGLSMAAMAGVAIYLFRFGIERRAGWFWAGLLLFFVAVGPSGAHSLREYLLGWSVNLVTIGTILGIIMAFFRNNALAYLAAAFCLLLVDPVVGLLSQPARFYRSNGLVLVAMALIVLGWMLLGGKRRPEIPAG